MRVPLQEELRARRALLTRIQYERKQRKDEIEARIRADRQAQRRAFLDELYEKRKHRENVAFPQIPPHAPAVAAPDQNSPVHQQNEGRRRKVHKPLTEREKVI
jgi:hypothetical protein